MLPRMEQAINIKSPEQQRLEARLGLDLAEYFTGQLAAGRSQAEIALALELNQGTVSRWMRQYGIRPTRRRKAA